MASVLSPNTLPNDIAPPNSPRDAGATYSLSFSVDDEDEVAPLPTRGRRYTLSITVDPKDAPSFGEKAPPLPTTIEGSGHTDNLKQLGLGLEAKDENVQALVRCMAALLANAASKEGVITTTRSRPLTTLSTSSSRPTLVENDSSSVSSEYVEIIHRPAHAVTSPRERTEFLVNLLPSSVTPSTAPGTPLDGNFAQLQPLLPQVEYSPSPLSAIRAEGPVTRDLITPVRPLATYDPSRRQPTQNSDSSNSSSIDLTDAPAVATVAVETPAKKAAIDKPIVATVAADNSTIILPSPPTDFEKTLYAQTRRVPLYVFGTLSFLSVSVGMWFFAISSTMFYWFGVFVGLIQIYLIISYMVGYCGKDFDVEAHKKLVAEHSYCSDKLPLVDIYLPCCHEPLEVLENTYKYVSQLQYSNFKVYVLDDGGLDTVKALAESFGFNYITRDNKPHLKKAGNLRYAFARTQGDFFVIFDADFCPRTDFLDEMLPYMNAHPDIAIVQSPQFFRPTKEQTWTEQGQP
ncbi:hypothetical protein NLJ89_g10082 [Agrocybe chaxingu]|uniref:Glycosyltransferase 2-like domain-containing protein n=1 Tax=Agrocybe chaxingu TaxID=84603 RepID=A0A9W8JUT4_9AGAR|nr:hypothetical protein NLJ89_g10082 [Agrocybe chaxingu]